MVIESPARPPVSSRQTLDQVARPDAAEPVFDVAIVGGGPVGSAVACALRDRGLQIAVIEARSQAAEARHTQAYAFSLLSAQIFNGLGLWEQVRPQIEPFRTIHLSDGAPGIPEDQRHAVCFHPADAGEPDLTELGYVAEHGVLVQALHAAINAAPDITWLCPATAGRVTYGDRHAPTDSEAALARIELTPSAPGEPLPAAIRARLVVAADGSGSPVRHSAGITTQGWPYWQSCIVAAVRTERPHNQIAYERFQPSGPFAILPLGDVCRIVWTAPHAEAQTLAALDDADFLQELQRRFGDQMGQLTLAGGRYVFSVKLMQSDVYVRSRLALVGDAAHACHPVGGQGLNMGLRDAAALAETILAARDRGEDIGNLTVLRRYDQWRRWENSVILAFTDTLDRMFSNDFGLTIALRRLGLWALDTFPPVKTTALRLMTGLLGRKPAIAQPTPPDPAALTADRP